MEFVVLLMPHGSREYIILQDYASIEWQYFGRNSRVQWSKWHEWWYNDKGERIEPDRWRLWRMWEQHHCAAYVAQFRATPWVQTLLKKMHCPPRAFDLWSPPVPESSVQSAGFHPKKGAQPKKRPVPKLKPKLMAQCKWEAKKRARTEATPAESTSSSGGAVIDLTGQEQTKPGGAKAVKGSVAMELGAGAVMPSVTGQEHTEPGGGASSSSAAAVHRAPALLLCPSIGPPPGRSRPPPSGPPPAKSRPPPTGTGQERSATGQDPPPSSPSAAAVSSVPCGVPWPCKQCWRMPWKCKCQKAEAEDSAPEHIEQIEQDYELMCKRAGVWAAAAASQSEADRKVAEPEPPEEHDERDMWGCSKCSTMNLRHDLVCRVVGCEQRRPLVDFQESRGDWICPDCQNHNWGFRRLCNWTACPSNDWRCECGNLNRSNRKFCNRGVCGLPRPFSYD